MLASRRLTFYSAPARQGFWAGTRSWLEYWLLIIAIIFFASLFASLLADPGCEVDPYAHGSTLDGQPVCSSAVTLQFNGIGVLLLAVSLGLALILLLLQVLFPHRWLALTVTPGGLASSYSRYARPVIGWAEIESLGLYEAPPDKTHRRPTIYLAVTIHSSEEMRKTEGVRLVWSAYAPAPHMERVALMWPIGRALDSGGKRLKPDAILARIHEEFARELAENQVDVFTTRTL
ncbi:MAG TPA: hypothetical protein VF725_03055 [Ktedonobacterales bacterium]